MLTQICTKTYYETVNSIVLQCFHLALVAYVHLFVSIIPHLANNYVTKTPITRSNIDQSFGKAAPKPPKSVSPSRY